MARREGRKPSPLLTAVTSNNSNLNAKICAPAGDQHRISGHIYVSYEHLVVLLSGRSYEEVE